MAPDDTIISFVKDFVWAPLLALIAWAYKSNADEHRSLWKKASKMEESMFTSSSTLNDRLLEHIDQQVRETRAFVVAEDTKIIQEVTRQRDVTAKIFDKLEENARRSDDRHAEVMKSIHFLSTTMHQALATKQDK